jgi:hypothetical protein
VTSSGETDAGRLKGPYVVIPEDKERVRFLMKTMKAKMRRGKGQVPQPCSRKTTSAMHQIQISPRRGRASATYRHTTPLNEPCDNYNTRNSQRRSLNRTPSNDVGGAPQRPRKCHVIPVMDNRDNDTEISETCIDKPRRDVKQDDVEMNAKKPPTTRRTQNKTPTCSWFLSRRPL